MLEIIGWVWLGIFIGFSSGVLLISILASGKQADLESEISHLRAIRKSMKEEILKLENQSKLMKINQHASKFTDFYETEWYHHKIRARNPILTTRTSEMFNV